MFGGLVARLGRLVVVSLALLAVVVGMLLADLGRGSRPEVGAAAPEVPAGEVAGAVETVPSRAPTTTTTMVPPAARSLELVDVIGGDIAAKSVVVTPTGLVFAQNMMYRHTVTVYDESGWLSRTITDTVDLARFGLDGGVVQGAPVEAASTSDGAFVYVSNYAMYGDGYDDPGDDDCGPDAGHDESFVYRIDTATLEIDQVIPVGAVPKYVAVTPDDRHLLVSNWCGYDLSVIDVATATEVTRVPLGPHPRGIAVDATSSIAYVTVMGGTDVAVVDLDTFDVEWLEGVGDGPRHLVLSPDDRWLYVTLNRAGRTVKVDLATGEVVASVDTGVAPRSMTMSPDGGALYIVNYGSDTMSKVLTDSFTEIQRVATGVHPIGVAYHPATHEVWVSNYDSGTIQVFADVVEEELVDEALVDGVSGDPAGTPPATSTP